MDLESRNLRWIDWQRGRSRTIAVGFDQKSAIKGLIDGICKTNTNLGRRRAKHSLSVRRPSSTTVFAALANRHFAS